MTPLYFLLIILGGGLGALCRYCVEYLGLFETNKYFYTTVINLSGCLVIGILWTVFQYFHASRGWYLGAITGFLGGFTTYSAFALDAVKLMAEGQWLRVAVYVGITVFGGLVACAIGIIGTKKLIYWMS